MLLPTLLLLAATATPATAPTSAATTTSPADGDRTRLLVFDVKSTGGVPKDTVENISGLIAALLSEDPRLEVLSGADLRSMVALESEREQLGCEQNTSCIAEVAGALDAKLVVIGDVGLLGSRINLNLSLYDQARARNIGRRAIQASSLDDLPEALRPALSALVVQALGARTDTAEAAPAGPGPDVLPLAVIGGGGVAAVAGVTMVVVGVLPAFSIASEEEKHLDGDTGALGRATALQEQWYESGLAPGLVIGGAALGVVGVVALAGGLVMMGGGE